MPSDLNSPAKLLDAALKEAPSLVDLWKKDKAYGNGKGWHEMVTSDHAGAHASCAALKLVTHPHFHLALKDRKIRSEWLTGGHLVPLFRAGIGGCENHQALEVRWSTVKIGNFISATSSLGSNASLKSTFRAALPLARQYVDLLLESQTEKGWPHWLGRDESQATSFATAVAVDALAKLAAIDGATAAKAGSTIAKWTELILSQLANMASRNSSPDTSRDMLPKLPLLRALSALPDNQIISRKLGVDIETVFNAFIVQPYFETHQSYTEDFDKFNGTASAGTDYVTFNSTTTMVQAIFGAATTGAISRAFLDWTVPFICEWAEQIRQRQIDEQPRFSLLYHRLKCLLNASILNQQTRAVTRRARARNDANQFLPATMPMNVNPVVFKNRTFKVKSHQGFYVTPFQDSLKKVDPSLNANNISKFVERACIEFTSDPDKRKIQLIRGDHDFTGPDIMDRIWQHINESYFVIALCVGANPNVYYEIGIAHTIGKHVLLLGRKSDIERDIVFDLRGVRYAELKTFDFDEIEPHVHKFLKAIYH